MDTIIIGGGTTKMVNDFRFLHNIVLTFGLRFQSSKTAFNKVICGSCCGKFPGLCYALRLKASHIHTYAHAWTRIPFLKVDLNSPRIHAPLLLVSLILDMSLIVSQNVDSRIRRENWSKTHKPQKLLFLRSITPMFKTAVISWSHL